MFRAIFETLREYVRPFYLRNVFFPLFPAKKPDYFNICWSFPQVQPTADPSLPFVLFLPMNDWHARTQRTQHLALALSQRGYRCVYLNPHLGREFPERFQPRAASRVTQLQPNLFEFHVHLPREPVFHHRLLSATESEFVANEIRNLLAAFGSPQTVQIVSLPVWFELAESLRQTNHARIIYDCHDFLPGFLAIAPPIIQKERDLFRSSDLVVCSAQALIERAIGFGAPGGACCLIRNAVAPELLDTVRIPSEQVVIGYVGALESWFDSASVRVAAEAHPEWLFHLYGRVENESVRKLAAFPNVHLGGEIPFSRLKEILGAFTVGVIPFVLDPLILATDPIKLYEYLAAGLPVVSADLPELARFGDTIHRYAGPADFVRKLELAVRSDNDAAAQMRRELGRQETWSERADALAFQIQQFPLW